MYPNEFVARCFLPLHHGFYLILVFHTKHINIFFALRQSELEQTHGAAPEKLQMDDNSICAIDWNYTTTSITEHVYCT